MKRSTAMLLASRMLCIFVGLILFLSAIEHLKNQQYFLVSLLRYKIFDGFPAELMAAFFPSLQLVLAVFLCSNLRPRLSGLVAAAMLLMFACVQASALARDLPISCGCFGPSQSSPISIFSILQVVAMALAMVFVVYVEKFRSSRVESHPVQVGVES